MFDDFSPENADDDSSALSMILLSASMMSLVVTVMGIKLKWFRHRLTFEQPENQVASPVLMRTSSVTEIRENCAGGVYRQSFDAEALIIREKPETNGNPRPKSSSECFSIMFLIAITHFLHALLFFLCFSYQFLIENYQLLTLIDYYSRR
jgi:hypothetical protein